MYNIQNKILFTLKRQKIYQLYNIPLSLCAVDDRTEFSLFAMY